VTRLLGISGSTRKESWNRALLLAAAELVPPAARLEIRDLHDVPNYNQDHNDQMGGTDTLEAVLALRRRIEQADSCPAPEERPRLVLMPRVTFNPGRKADPAPWRLGQSRRDGPRPASPKTGAAVHKDAGADRKCLQVPNAAEPLDDEGRLAIPEIRAQLQKLLNELATAAA
jgi:NADPH-dependent FMN reductase